MYFQRLEDLRVDADLTQEQVAQVLHCKREVYRRYEKGIHELPVWALIELAKFYGTSTDYILGLSDIRGKAGTKVPAFLSGGCATQYKISKTYNYGAESM